MRISNIFLALIPAGIIFSSLSAIAEPRCPQSISSENPRRTMTSYTGGNIPLEQPVLVENQGAMYRIPAGYFLGWLSEKHKLRNGDVIGNDLNEIQHREVVGIAFWMPSARYPERNLIGDEYIVKV